MKICIFGADGKTGIEIIQYAIKKRFEIVAFVYGKTIITHVEEDIKKLTGDVLNYDQVLQACVGCDAIISVLGHVKNSDTRMQTKGIANIVLAMKENNIQRIISLTGTGVRIEGDSPSFIDKVLNFIIKKIDPDRIKDGIEHAKVLESSGLDWTIVRVLKLGNDKKNIENYTLTKGGPAELQTSRKKVAHVMVDLIEDKSYVGKMPVISG
jgi:putative NADH-flavin reductase